MSDTQLAQMALSAIIRSSETVDIITLSEVLRGQNTRAVKVLGLNQIKTFGAGKLWSKEAWFYMLIQMLQQGLFEINYKGHYDLHVTELGHRVLKNEQVVVFEDGNRSVQQLPWNNRINSNAVSVSDSVKEASDSQELCFKRNGLLVCIDSEISNEIDWKGLTQSLQSSIYWNYKCDKWVHIGNYVPRSVEKYEKVKARFLEIVREIFGLRVKDDCFFIPKKDDFDIDGVLVEPLNFPFEHCLQMLEHFIVANGRYPSMKAKEEEVALRKWFREAWHGIIPISDDQKQQLSLLKEKYPNIHR